VRRQDANDFGPQRGCAVLPTREDQLWTMTSPRQSGERAALPHAEFDGRVHAGSAADRKWTLRCPDRVCADAGRSGARAGYPEAMQVDNGRSSSARRWTRGRMRMAVACLIEPASRAECVIESLTEVPGRMPEPELVGQPGGGPEIIEAWRVDYNTVRPHSSLDIEPRRSSRRKSAGKRAVEKTLRRKSTNHFPLR